MRNPIIAAGVLAATLIAIAPVAAQVQPDLWIRGVVITKFEHNGGSFIDKITVGVSNNCPAPAGASYVLVTFKTSAAKDAKSIFFIGNTVKALNGGETQVQTFDVHDKFIGVGRHVFVEVDPYKKVTEASEDNNWRTLYPDGKAPTLTPGQCSAKM